jgi:hypothetical protein
MMDDNKKRYSLRCRNYWVESSAWTLAFFRTFSQSSLSIATFLQLFAPRALPDILDHTTLPSQSGSSNFPISSGLVSNTFLTVVLFSIRIICSPQLNIYFYVFSNIAYRTVAIQRQQDGRIYQGRFCATAR